MPYLELCNQALGISLPADLQAKVDNGDIAPEDAAELSTSRFANARLQSQTEANTAAQVTARANEEQASNAAAVNGAVSQWETETRARDPDYARKVAAVVRISQAMIAENGRPNTPAAGVELAKLAYQEANRMFAGAMPAPVPTRKGPEGAPNNGNVRPEPKTFMEAAMSGLTRSRTK
jgi:hypothetical protein